MCRDITLEPRTELRDRAHGRLRRELPLQSDRVARTPSGGRKLGGTAECLVGALRPSDRDEVRHFALSGLAYLSHHRREACDERG